MGKECATHFDLDFWYTALGKVHGGHLPDPTCNGLCMAFEKTGFRTEIGVGVHVVSVLSVHRRRDPKMAPH